MSGCVYGDIFHLLDERDIIVPISYFILDQEHHRCDKVHKPQRFSESGDQQL